MKAIRWALVGAFLAEVLGCGQSGQHDPFNVAAPPFPHRAAAIACSHDRPPGIAGPATVDAGPLGVGCNTDADCTQLFDNGRCIPPGPTGLRGRCSYETCFADSDCHNPSPLSTSVCVCGTAIPGQSTRTADACFPGECRTDADCTGQTGQFCSQAMVYAECFSGREIAGFYCRSLHEECSTDADCADGGANTYCSFVGHGKRWACLPPRLCAG
jgi:hypothetical protein